VNLSIAICAHISRKEQAEALSREVGAPISMDHGDLGCVANHERSLRLAVETPADWDLVLEDDASLVPDFSEQVRAALAVCPAPFASLIYPYIGSPDPEVRARLEKHDPCWVMRQGLDMALAVAVRADYVQDLLEVSEAVGAELPHLPADHRWGEAMMRLGFWVPHAYPSLVEHADGRSLMIDPPDGFERRAYRVGGRKQWTEASI